MLFLFLSINELKEMLKQCWCCFANFLDPLWTSGLFIVCTALYQHWRMVWLHPFSSWYRGKKLWLVCISLNQSQLPWAALSPRMQRRRSCRIVSGGNLFWLNICKWEGKHYQWNGFPMKEITQTSVKVYVDSVIGFLNTISFVKIGISRK